jgi:hypothetical protein
MIISKRLSRPEFQFLALAVCLLPLGIFGFHSSWPPWGWKHVHFAESDIGKTILACSGLFFGFALAYFFLPEDISSLHEPNAGPNSFLVECDCVPRSIGTANLFQSCLSLSSG